MDNLLSLGMFETLMVAVVAIYLGEFLRSKVSALRKFCIPASVVGGVIFAIISMGLYYSNILELNFEKDFVNRLFYCFFFAASGAAASMSLLKKGGKLVLIFAVLATIFSILQNTVALTVGNFLGVNPLISMMTGSVPLTGGHGNAAAFAPIAVEAGAKAATEVAMAAATFGLIAGSFLGGPFGNFIIKKHKLEDPEKDGKTGVIPVSATNEPMIKVDKDSMTKAVFLIILACGFGQVFKLLVDSLGIGSLQFPIHVWCMLGGIVVRLILDKGKNNNDNLYESMDIVGEFSLSLFVSISIVSMKLWQLAGLGTALFVLLLAQIILILFFCYFLTFNLLGRNYDSAIMAVGHTGFGLGAVPVSMTTMQTVCKKYRYSKLAFFVVPVIGGFISNITNAIIITKFLDIAAKMAN